MRFVFILASMKSSKQSSAEEKKNITVEIYGRSDEIIRQHHSAHQKAEARIDSTETSSTLEKWQSIKSSMKFEGECVRVCEFSLEL